MAYVSTNRIAGKSLMDRVAGLVDSAATYIQQRRVYAQTVAELNALTDRELADLGIARAAISEIAHEAAYGN